MSTYLFAFRAPKGYQPGPDTMSPWQAWFEGLGPNIADTGNPIFARSSVGNTGGETELGGYTLITADSLDAAVALAGGCPLVGNGGGVEVGEITPLESMQAPDGARAANVA
jgi:hypothetical protein